MPRGKKSQKAAKVPALMENIQDNEEKEEAKLISHPPTSYEQFLETMNIVSIFLKIGGFEQSFFLYQWTKGY